MSDQAQPGLSEAAPPAPEVSHVETMNAHMFRSLYRLKAPRGTTRPCHQLALSTSSGLQIIPPINGVFAVDIQMLMNTDDAEAGRHLWVFREQDEAVALEACSFAIHFPDSKVKHTNITGNHCAYCGGELWLSSGNRIIMNGSSGRYRTESETQLLHAGRVVKAYGFDMGIMKFLSSGKPRAIIQQEEDLMWL